MTKYLYRCTIENPQGFGANKHPVYAVAESEDKVREYVERYLRKGKVKSVALLGERLGMNLYYRGR